MGEEGPRGLGREGRADDPLGPGVGKGDPLLGLPPHGLPPLRGGRAPRRVSWEVVRPVRVPDDLPLLSERAPAARQSLKTIRHTHHQLARLVASGVDDAESSLITGYSPSYISRIKSDPSFESLLAYYHEQKEAIFVDVTERMRQLGLATLDELQNRLEDEPDEWSRRELMELAELMLVKPAAARTNLNVAAPIAPVSVNVKFVTAQPREPVPITGIVIENTTDTS